MKTTKLALCIAFASLAFGLRGEEVDTRLFARKVELTVYGYSGSGAVENFPLLVRLDPEKITGFSYASFTRDDGSDMMFHDAEGNEIPHDIDTWNTQGESLVWVRVPYLSGKETKLTLYFGRAEGATGNFSRADVWSRYAAVWHLNEGDSDATGHGLAAAPHGGGTTPESNDILGHGYSNSGQNQNRLLLDSPGDYVSSIDSESSLLSVSCWVKLNGNPDTKRLVCWKNDYAETKGCELIESSDGVMLRASNGSGSETPVAHVSWNKTAWTHIVGVYSNKTAWGYCNGAACAMKNNSTTSGDSVKKNTAKIGFGGMGGSSTDTTYGCDAHLDELRFFNGIVSADWAQAECETVTNSNYVAFGEVEQTVANAVVLAGAPTVVRAADGLSWTWSVEVQQGVGEIFAVYTEVESGLAVTNYVGAASGAGTLSKAPEGLLDGVRYSYAALCRTTVESGVVQSFLKAGSGEFVPGVLSVTASGTAREAGFVRARFTVTRIGGTYGDFFVRCQFGGTAVNGRTYNRLSETLVIPDGASSATIEVVPLPDGLMTEDSTVTMALDASCHLFSLSGGEATITILNDASVDSDPTVRFLSPTGDDDKDGTTLLTAKATLRAAISSLGSTGGTVKVADGTYVDETTTATLYEISTPVTVCSLSGVAENVVFTKGSQSARIFKLAHAGAVLRRITVRDGGFVNACGNGGNIFMSAGLIEECVISGGSAGNGSVAADNWSTGGGNIYMSGGRVSRSVVTNGLLGAGQLYGSGIYCAGGTVENTLIAKCRSTADANVDGAVRFDNSPKMYNCTIVDNYMAKGRPGIFLSQNATPKIYNTVIHENASGDQSGADLVHNGRSLSSFMYCATDVEISGGTGCIAPSDFGLWPNYTLRASSPLVDAGTSYAELATYDLAGRRRVIGSGVDIGCYEAYGRGLQVYVR